MLGVARLFLWSVIVPSILRDWLFLKPCSESGDGGGGDPEPDPCADYTESVSSVTSGAVPVWSDTAHGRALGDVIEVCPAYDGAITQEADWPTNNQFRIGPVMFDSDQFHLEVEDNGSWVSFDLGQAYTGPIPYKWTGNNIPVIQV